MNRYFEMALAVAMTSTMKRGRRHGAILVKRKRVVAARPNINKTHPRLAKFSPFPSLHAETACLFVAGEVVAAGSDLYVVRVNEDPLGYAMSRPCDVCLHMLRDYGIRRVYYSISNNEYGVLRF